MTTLVQPTPRKKTASPREPVALDIDMIVPWLLETHILEPSAIVHGGLTVEDRTRRNRNFLVRKKDGTGFVVKNVKSFADTGLVTSLRNEGDFLRALAYDDILEPFAPRAPRLVHYDPARCILVTELIHPATSLTKYHLNLGAVEFPREGATSAARLLADFHEAGRRALEAGRLSFSKRGLPIALAIFEYLDQKGRTGDATARAFVRRLTGTKVGPGNERLRALAASWSQASGLAHGDARWDNFLLTHGSSGRSDLNLKLIDWELVARGDPAYDVASWLGEYFRFQAATAVWKGVQIPTELTEKAAFAIADGAASARAFVEAYLRRRRIHGSARREFLQRVAQFLPQYLVQVGWEMTMSYTVNGRDGDIAPWSLHILERALEAGEDPAAALRAWFGLEVEA